VGVREEAASALSAASNPSGAMRCREKICGDGRRLYGVAMDLQPDASLPTRQHRAIISCRARRDRSETLPPPSLLHWSLHST
jgi:hypothetical protein